MSIPKLLFELQTIDLELDANEQTLNKITSQLEESEKVITAKGKLAAEQKQLEELQRQQRSLETETNDLSVKLKTNEDDLYSGKIKNPKELANLQHEIEALKAKRSQLEEKTLEIINQVEDFAGKVAASTEELKSVESEWQSQHRQFVTQIEQLKVAITNLKQQRQLATEGIEPQTLQLYLALKKQKKTAVARVEQGICRGCRISLPVAILQQARSGNLVRCSSCGRILFLA